MKCSLSDLGHHTQNEISLFRKCYKLIIARKRLCFKKQSCGKAELNEYISTVVKTKDWL